MATDTEGDDDPIDGRTPPLLGRVTGLPAPEVGPPAVVAALGLATFVAAAWNLRNELAGLRVVLPPAVAFLIGAGLAGIVWYGAYRLWNSEFDGSGRWLIAGFCAAGGVLQLAVAALTILVRLLEGRTVAELPFVLFTFWGIGTVGGLMVGWLYARVRRDAARARRARDRFSFLNSTLRHDVLNNMMIVKSRAEFIRDETDGRTADFADTIVDRSDDVVAFVERVRSLLTALSEDSDRERARIDLSEAVRTRTAGVADAYDGVTVEAEVPDGVTVLAGDLLEDVIGNLLRNAVEHNDADEPRIVVTVETDDDRVRLRVADNGPGVPDDLKDAVFRRGRSGIHEDGTGSGFGLFFVDSMVTHYGGDAWIEDNDPRGAVFVVELDRPDD